MNDSEKMDLLHKIAKNRGWILPDKVSKFILNHFDRDLYFLCNVIKNIDERSLSEKKNITIPFIKKIIKHEIAFNHKSSATSKMYLFQRV